MWSHRAVICLLSLLYCINYVRSARFLGVTFPLKGQLIEVQTLLVELANRGHEVFLAVGEHAASRLPKHVVSDKVKILTFSTRSDWAMGFETPAKQKEGFLAYFDDPMERILPLKTIQFKHETTKMLTTEYTEDMLGDPVFNKMVADMHIDMLIMHNCFQLFPTAYLLPYKHNLRYITSTFIPLAFAGIPLLPSVNPSPISPFTDDMTFLQRTANFLLYAVIAQIISPPQVPSKYYREYLPGKEVKTLPQLMVDSELFIVTAKHAVLDYPQATVPNVILAGGINTRPAEPLSKELQAFMESHREGVVVVTFGSWASYFPAHITSKMLEAFAKIQYGVIWRFMGTQPEHVPSRIKLLPWIPQNDLLGHPNTKLFVSHCGNGGSFEALYHGIPILGLPLFLDQIYNNNRARHKGMAIGMNIIDFTPDELAKNINDMIENKTYFNAAKKLSAIYREQPMTSQELASSWIEHVLKHGGAYLRSPGTRLPWYQYYLLDVIAFLMLIVVTMVTLCIACCRCLCRVCCSNKGPALAPAKLKTK